MRTVLNKTRVALALLLLLLAGLFESVADWVAPE